MNNIMPYVLVVTQYGWLWQVQVHRLHFIGNTRYIVSLSKLSVLIWKIISDLNVRIKYSTRKILKPLSISIFDVSLQFNDGGVCVKIL
jgi:hypothetical protein